eukprot:scaffold23567_cov188-Skeletonema_menzelii.AAC.1
MAIESFHWPIILGADSKEGNIFGANTSHSKQRCFIRLAVLMRPDLGWPSATHLPFKTYVTHVL